MRAQKGGEKSPDRMCSLAYIKKTPHVNTCKFKDLEIQILKF